MRAERIGERRGPDASTPLPRQVDIVIIGAGFAGIGMAIQLKAAGRDDFVVLEQHSELGGTWRDNTYPGCACDVPSPLYSFSFDPNPRWSRFFASQDEIWDYLRDSARRHGIEPHLRCEATVTAATFDAQEGRWHVEVNGREVIEARVVVSAVGALQLPKVPDLPGLDSFAGVAFHSARWRHDHDLRGRDVAVVGTGASAVQFVPAIAPSVNRIDLYQRSAAWITPKPNPRVPEERQRAYARQPLRQRAVRDAVYWALEARGVGFALTPRAMRALERQARAHLRRQVDDPGLRARLTPDYQIGCKRVLLSSDFYPAVASDTVELVTDPIAHVTPRGIVDATGVERAVDTIIFGTGFDVAGNLTHFPIRGRDGRLVGDVWAEQGVGAHLGITAHGFPNLFFLLGPNTGLGHSSVLFMIEAQMRYVGQALDLLDRHGAAAVEVRAEPQRVWVGKVQRQLSHRVWQSGCSSWYLDASGRNIAIYPHFTWRYWMETRRLKPADFQLYPPRTG